MGETGAEELAQITPEFSRAGLAHPAGPGEAGPGHITVPPRALRVSSNLARSMPLDKPLILTIKVSGGNVRRMSKPSTDLVQGTLDLLILKSLSIEPMHGFGIARRIQTVSQDVFRVNPGSLMVAFQRLERGGLIKGEWRITENNRRARFYQLSAKGRRQLEQDTDDWERRSMAIARLLEAK